MGGMKPVTIVLIAVTSVCALLALLLGVSGCRDYRLKHNLHKGLRQLAEGKTTDAVESFRRAHGARPGYMPTYDLLANVLSSDPKAGGPAAAAPVYEQMLAVNSEHVPGLVGFALWSVGDFYRQNPEATPEQLRPALEQIRGRFIAQAVALDSTHPDVKIASALLDAENVFAAAHAGKWSEGVLTVKDGGGLAQQAQSVGRALVQCLDNVQPGQYPALETYAVACNAVGCLKVVEGDLQKAASRLESYRDAEQYFLRAMAYRLPWDVPAKNLFGMYGRLLGDRNLPGSVFLETVANFNRVRKQALNAFGKEYSAGFNAMISRASQSAAVGLYDRALATESMDDLTAALRLLGEADTLLGAKAATDDVLMMKLQMSRVIYQMLRLRDAKGIPPPPGPNPQRPWSDQDLDQYLQNQLGLVRKASPERQISYYLLCAAAALARGDIKSAEQPLLKTVPSLSGYPKRYQAHYFRMTAILLDLKTAAVTGNQDQLNEAILQAVDFYQKYLDAAKEAGFNADEDFAAVQERMNVLSARIVR